MDKKINSFREIISYINSLDSAEQIEEFVKNRYAELEGNSLNKTIDKNTNGLLIGTIKEGYINSKSPIISSYLVSPFYMNDISLYIEFIKFIKGKNLNNPLQIFHELQDFIILTFGFNGNQNIRQDIYLQKRNKMPISIANFYKNNSALCTERSAVVQNLAAFLGLKSYLLLGELETLNSKEEHAFNILKMKDGTLILFDSTNPVTLKNGYVPAYSIIGKKDISSLETISFDFNKLCEIYNQPLNTSEIPNRTYITCNYYLNNNKSISK